MTSTDLNNLRSKDAVNDNLPPLRFEPIFNVMSDCARANPKFGEGIRALIEQKKFAVFRGRTLCVSEETMALFVSTYGVK